MSYIIAVDSSDISVGWAPAAGGVGGGGGFSAWSSSLMLKSYFLLERLRREGGYGWGRWFVRDGRGLSHLVRLCRRSMGTSVRPRQSIGNFHMITHEPLLGGGREERGITYIRSDARTPLEGKKSIGRLPYMDLCHKSFVPTFSGVGGGGGGGTRTREEEEGGITIPCYGGLAQKCFFFKMVLISLLSVVNCSATLY